MKQQHFTPNRLLERVITIIACITSLSNSPFGVEMTKRSVPLTYD